MNVENVVNVAILRYWQVLIPVFLVICHLLLRRRFYTDWNPVSLIVLWWGGWLWVATYSFTGIYPPSEKALLCTLVFLIGLAAGPWLISRGDLKQYKFNPEHGENIPLVQFVYKVFPWVTVVTAAMVVPPFLRAVYRFIENGPFMFKSEAFGNLDRPGYIFKSNLLESLYFFLSGPLLLGLLLIGMALFFSYGKKRELIWAITLNVLDGVMRLGRINIFMACLLVSFGVFIVIGLRKSNPLYFRSLLRPVFQLTGVGVLLFAIVVSIGYSRKGTHTTNFTDHLKLYVIEYHTLGFALFDKQLSNPDSELNTKTTFGRLSIGGLESILTIFIRRFDRDYNSPALVNAVRLSKSEGVGEEIVDGKKQIKGFNSFYTLLYTFYSDFRFFGLFLGGLVLSALTTWAYLSWRQLGAFEPLVWIFLLLSIGVFGIFVSTLEIMRTWILIVLFAFASYWSRRQFSQTKG